MTRRSTAILLLSAALLAACRRQPTNARVDAAIAPLIPAGTVALAGLRLDRLKSTKFFQNYVEGRQIPALNELREKTGLDPVNDVWELVWAFRPAHSVVFIRGKFGGQFGLEPRFNVPGIQKMSYKSYYILHQEGRGVLFFNSGVAVAGLIPDLQAVVDQRDQPSRVPPAELIDKVASLPACHAYAVALNGGALVPGLPAEGNMANFARMANSLGEATLHADLTDGIDLKAEAHYPDAALAKQLQDTARGAIGLLRLRTPTDQPELLHIFDGIQVNAQDRKVLMTAVAPFDLIDQVVRSLPISSAPGSRPPDSSTPRPR
jgi:hypothetical protein